MTEPAPPAPEVKRDDDLEEFDLPFFQRLALRLQVVVLEILTRITDVLLLLRDGHRRVTSGAGTHETE